MDNMDRPATKPALRAAGFSVHLFTASGGAVALLALYAAIERDFTACFAWLGVALFIDGVDGTLARAALVLITDGRVDANALADAVSDAERLASERLALHVVAVGQDVVARELSSLCAPGAAGDLAGERFLALHMIPRARHGDHDAWW